ncbi:MAG: tetratricopeptide repeat protein [Bacteroidaceae bacterium]|nr:tetratricopeptide repeat protein [Bacteroidaceae bacterium]
MRLIIIIATLLFATASHAQSYKELVSNGTRNLEKGDTEAAIKNYNEAIDKEPENRHNEYVYANLAAAYQKNGNAKKAEEMYTKALSLNPSSTKLLQQRGNLYLDTDKKEKALADYDKILEKEPYNEETLYYRAYIFAQEKEYEKAYTDYYKILTANPDNNKARFALALLYNKNKKNEEALLLIDNLIDKSPHTPE